MPVKVLAADGTGNDSDIIQGVMWAADNGASVILMAFSNPGFSDALQDAIDYAWAHNVVLVAAAGNDASNIATFPAGDRGVIGVSATDQNDALAPTSTFGGSVFLAAPGVSILGTYPNNTYVTWTGTSASAAIVAGTAALMRAVDPSLSNGVVVNRIARTADVAGTQEQTGNGRVNVARAVGDTSTDAIQPAGTAPYGNGGPFVGPYQAAATNAKDGDGTMTVAPITVIANSTGNTLTFTFTAPNGGDFNLGSQATILVPAAWTTPTTSNVAVAVGPAPNCTAATRGTITGSTIPINMTCPAKAQFSVTFSSVTAPSIAGANPFTTQTKQNGGTLTSIGTSTTVTVNAAAATKLAITSVNGGTNPAAGTGFSVVVQAQDSFGNPSNVTANTGVTLSRKTGTGTPLAVRSLARSQAVATRSQSVELPTLKRKVVLSLRQRALVAILSRLETVLHSPLMPAR